MKKGNLYGCRALIALSALTYSGSGFALPTLYPDQPNRVSQVTNHTSSTALADSVDPNRYYVLPGSAGTATPIHVSMKSANLGFCNEMATTQKTSELLEQTAQESIGELEKLTHELPRKVENADKLGRAAAEKSKSSQSLQQADKLSDRVRQIEERLDTLYSDENTCKNDACNGIDQELSGLRNEKEKDEDELASIRRKFMKEYDAWEQAKEEATEAQSEVNNLLNTISSYNESLSKIQAQVRSNYEYFAKLEGSFAEIQYDTGWDANVDTLRSDNPSLSFEKIQTENVLVSASLIGANSSSAYYDSLPAVLDYTVNGVPQQAVTSNGSYGLSALPSQMHASLRLSLVGACPIEHPELFDIKKVDNVPAFSIAAQYEYPSVFKTKISFTYNLWKFYEKIKEESSSGGLFWSSSSVSISETNLGDSTFHADWNESDPDNVVPEDQKRKIESEVKQELIQRVLAQMAVPAEGAEISGVGALNPPEHGAVVLADGIQATCGYYSYWCVGGAWVLRSLDAIFGSSDSVQSYIQSVNQTASEVWSRETMRLKPAVTVMGSSALSS